MLPGPLLLPPGHGVPQDNRRGFPVHHLCIKSVVAMTTRCNNSMCVGMCFDDMIA